MTIPNIKFIVNPVAGQGAGSKVEPEITRLAREHLLDYELVKTEHIGHAMDLAREGAIAGFHIIGAVGGDGTSNEVLNGLMQAWNQGYRNTKMAIIGIGRGNDFAYAFGIPPGLEAGFQLIRQGKTRSMDVGYIVGGDYPQGRYFGNGVGIGFDAVVGFEAKKLTHIHGFLNYVVAALRTIFLFFNAPAVEIEIDHQKLIQPCLMISIMNGRRMGGGFMMAPDALGDDGLLDLCIVGQLSRLGILAMIPKFMQGTQAAQPKVKTYRAERIHVTAMKGTLPAHADGETICTDGSKLTVEIIKKPLEILTG